MNGILFEPVPIIATIFFCTKLRDIGTFSKVLDADPTLYTSFNKSSVSSEKRSSGTLIFPTNSAVPTPNLKSKKSVCSSSLSQRFLFF